MRLGCQLPPAKASGLESFWLLTHGGAVLPLPAKAGSLRAEKAMNELYDREAYLESKDNILDRSWVTELWMKVIQKAMDDLATFIRMEEDQEEISEEDWGYAETAYNFLFDPEYIIDENGKGMTLEELLEHWQCCNINTWRKLTRKKIQVLVKEKRKMLLVRRNRKDVKR